LPSSPRSAKSATGQFLVDDFADDAVVEIADVVCGELDERHERLL